MITYILSFLRYVFILLMRVIIMVTLIFNMYVDNVSSQINLPTPLQNKTKKNEVTFWKNYIKRRKKLDLNFKVYKTKSVLKANIYQRQKLYSHVVFDLMNTSLGITSHLWWNYSPHFENSAMKFPDAFSTLKVCECL